MGGDQSEGLKEKKSKKNKVSWSKTLVRKWFNIRSKAEDFHADLLRGGDEGMETCTLKKSKSEALSRRSSNFVQVTSLQNYSVFAATWNVGGKSPPSYLRLEDWLSTSPPTDIYVLGFQEIVPLNAGNVLGSEDNVPAKKWVDLVRKTLNTHPGVSNGSGVGECYMHSPIPGPVVESDSDFEGSSRKNSSFFNRRSFNMSRSRSLSLRVDNDMSFPPSRLDRRYSVCDRGAFGRREKEYDDLNYIWSSSDDDNATENPTTATPFNGRFIEERGRPLGNSSYCLVASKQMVGILLMVWVKSDLTDAVRNLKVSCVGRGLMGYLGNKGSISISMSLHNTTFCFICSHLTSGEKDGDELRRNSDVMEILRKTRFPLVNGPEDLKSPQTILEHDRIIWLGDLNYRIALSYSSAKILVQMRDWKTLLDNDQLRLEQMGCRVFLGWMEGNIYFPPTYKYSNNSDRYAGDVMHPKEKRRTPAWCDRILWYGRGFHQLSYVRGESRFSDHRPVYSLFSVEVELISRGKVKRNTSWSSSRVEVEEMLPNSLEYDEL